MLHNPAERHSTKTLSRNTPLTDNYYRVTIFVKDNGAFDMDKTEGSALIAPAILQSKDTSSGGCNAGFAGTALIFAIALLPIAQKRKNHSKNVSVKYPVPGSHQESGILFICII